MTIPSARTSAKAIRNNLHSDSLFEQIANITKANGYDILAKQVIELKQVIMELIDVGELEDIEFNDSNDTAEFKKILNKAKILSIGLITDKVMRPIDYFMAANMTDEQIKETLK